MAYAHLAPQHQLAAVQRLCDTNEPGAVQNGATDTRTSPSGSKAVKNSMEVLQ
jgi:hypothetical protein